jgi:hypothetical protein
VFAGGYSWVLPPESTSYADEVTSMTTYYPDSKGIAKAEIAAVSDWMAEKKLLVVCS